MGRAVRGFWVLILLAGCDGAKISDVPVESRGVVWLTYDEADVYAYPEVALLKIYLAMIQSTDPRLASFADSALETLPVERVLTWVHEEALREAGKPVNSGWLAQGVLEESAFCRETRVRGSGLVAIHYLRTCVGSPRIIPFRQPGPTYPGSYAARGIFSADLLSFIPYGETGTFEVSLQARLGSAFGGGDVLDSLRSSLHNPTWCIAYVDLPLSRWFDLLLGVVGIKIPDLPSFPDDTPDPGDLCGYEHTGIKALHGTWLVGGPGFAGWTRTGFHAVGTFEIPPHGFIRNCEVHLEMDETGVRSVSGNCH